MAQFVAGVAFVGAVYGSSEAARPPMHTVKVYEMPPAPRRPPKPKQPLFHPGQTHVSTSGGLPIELTTVPEPHPLGSINNVHGVGPHINPSIL
eukprot:TRINITY_DN31364_c0_g1_i1.p1 TRINITY_DN31364_c0_g1~~TRINITY_DN31364_c0_g1_i1.p1  ORF type:complete len:109 (+),score=11.12 TRINITY_DN31364_c0_g1_i1:50-328(+)